MTEEEKREKRNARRRQDPNRPLEFVKLFISTMDGLLDVRAKQCQDYIGMLKYLAMHPQMGGFIPGAATWGKEKCMRVLGIRGEISADCPLFYRENGGIRCTGETIGAIAELIGIRIINKDNAKGGGGAESTGDRMDDRTEKEEEEEEEEKSRVEGENSFPAPPRPTQSTSPRTPTNSALGKLTARETQPADQDDQAEPLEQGARKQPTYEDVLECVTWRFQSLGINDGMAIEAAAREYWRERQAHGWIGENGEAIQNWMNHARLFVEERTKAVRADAGNAPTLADVQEVMGGEIANPDKRTECAKAFLAGWNTAGNHGGHEWQPEAISYAKGWIEPPPGDDEDEQGEDEPDFSDYRY